MLIRELSPLAFIVLHSFTGVISALPIINIATTGKKGRKVENFVEHQQAVTRMADYRLHITLTLCLAFGGTYDERLLVSKEGGIISQVLAALKPHGIGSYYMMFNPFFLIPKNIKMRGSFAFEKNVHFRLWMFFLNTFS